MQNQTSKTVLTIDVDAFVAIFVGRYDYSVEQIQEFLDGDCGAVDWTDNFSDTLSDLDIEAALFEAVRDAFRKKLGQTAASGS
ncbi:hypothetical protein EJC49_14910 [Aquibium carbonis]|uniref:Uncharacterized protein n=1 Tax=Aquibium carbonis TaxID=2495581 RepID=A0A429YVV4_9HYPH|nr:hypothetical protein [Aquibium carbonis]RST85591.1 hypothetical protein EJC49_14910 [Aquibium carbonis]